MDAIDFGLERATNSSPGTLTHFGVGASGEIDFDIVRFDKPWLRAITIGTRSEIQWLFSSLLFDQTLALGVRF